MQRLEVSGAVRPSYVSLDVKGLNISLLNILYENITQLPVAVKRDHLM